MGRGSRFEVVLWSAALWLSACAAGAPTPAEAEAEAVEGCLAQAEQAKSQGRAGHAADIYLEGCEREGNTRCCESWAHEQLGKAPYEQVLDKLYRACDEDVAACLRAGDVIRTRAPAAAGRREGAASFYRLACEDHTQRLQRQTSRGGPRTAPGACVHFHGGICRRGAPEAPAICQQALTRLLDEQQFTVAREVSALLCEHSETSGCGTLGELWTEGKGGPTNHERAVEALSRGCEGGDAHACEWLPKAKRGVEAKARFERCEDVPPNHRSASLPPGAPPSQAYTSGPFESASLRFCSGSCVLSRPATNLDAIAIWPLVSETVAERRRALASCGEKDSPVLMRMTARDGGLVAVAAEGPEADCLEKALVGAKAAFTGTCAISVRLP